MRCISICHCLGVAVGSLEKCTHVIPMPELHNLALVLMGICSLLSWHAQPNLVLAFPTHHTFIYDDKDAIISILLVFMGLYIYTFIYFGMHKL